MNRAFLGKSFILAFTCCLFWGCSSMGKSTIKIQVTDPDGNPIDGARVTVNGKVVGTSPGITVEVPGDGDIQIAVAADGYYPNTIVAVKTGSGKLKEEQIIWLTPNGTGGANSSYYTSSIAVKGQRGSNTGVQGAVNRTCRELIEKLPQKVEQPIAVLNCATNETETALYVMEEIEYQLVNSGQFTLVDRKKLDEIRAEQDFQLSGEVDDNDAVSIGHMTGAKIVITGSISSAGNAKNLRVKALDVETGRILAMTSEQIQ
jgi:hypothetical protein